MPNPLPEYKCEAPVHGSPVGHILIFLLHSSCSFSDQRVSHPVRSVGIVYMFRILRCRWAILRGSVYEHIGLSINFTSILQHLAGTFVRLKHIVLARPRPQSVIHKTQIPFHIPDSPHFFRSYTIPRYCYN